MKSSKRIKKIISLILLIIIFFCAMKIYQKRLGYYTDSRDYDCLLYTSISCNNFFPS